MKKRTNKGSILVETFVAIAIILIMTGSFVTLAIAVKSSFEKSTLATQATYKIENIQNIFLVSNFARGGGLSFKDFEQNLAFAFSVFDDEKTGASAIYTLNFNKKFQQVEDGQIEINIILSFKNPKLSLTVLAENSGKLLIKSDILTREVVL